MKVQIIANTIDESNLTDVKISDGTGGHCFVECRTAQEARRFINGFKKLLEIQSMELCTEEETTINGF